MRQFYFIILMLFSFGFLQAQIINIPDTNFKNAIIEDGYDLSGDGEIQTVEALSIITLQISNEDISDLTGIEFFENLVVLNCGNNNLSSLVINNLTNLEILACSGNSLESLVLSNLPGLDELYASNNQLTNLDISQAPNLQTLYCDNNPIVFLFVKNGSVFEFSAFLNFDGLSNLQYICCDEQEIQQVEDKITFYGYNNVEVNSYCSFVLGGDYFVARGSNIFDNDNDGCDVDDLKYPLLKYNVNNGMESGVFSANLSGDYSIPLPSGIHTITPILENPSYFDISPSSITVDFPNDPNPSIQDFCITPNGVHNDLDVIVIPIDGARPGFNASYKIIYKNKGNTVLSGTLGFKYFNDDYVNFVSAEPLNDSQNGNILGWNYIDLVPFESREIEVVMNLNPPTDPNFPLNSGDILSYNAQILPLENDEEVSDNQFSLRQFVVNSFDPNDKRCLEGETIREAVVGQYVHYMVRFENTGTANAINVVIKDEIDTSKYDLNTLIPLDASHDFVTRIQNTNEVEFIFENIDLPFDDANNDGYVVFKIKTLETLTVGDTFSNDAEIYFDFNFPIITNDYTTTVEDNLSLEDQELRAKVKIFPNPVGDKLFITSEVNIKKVSIYDINGRLLQTIMFYGNETQRTVDLQQLAGGVYVIKLSAENGELTQKIIKE